MSKILIGVPTFKGHKHCAEEVVNAIKGQTISADTMFVVNNGEEAYVRYLKSLGVNAVENPKSAKEPRDHVLNNRSYLRDYAGLDYDYLFLVSSDVVLPKAALEKLLMVKKDIVAAPYLNVFELGGKKVIAPKVFKDKGNGDAQLMTYEGMFPQRVEEIGAAGLGCVLLSKKAFAIPFSKMQTGKADDIQFYLDARKKGINAYVLTGVRCTHRPFPKDNELASAFEWRTAYEDTTYQVEIKKS